MCFTNILVYWRMLAHAVSELANNYHLLSIKDFPLKAKVIEDCYTSIICLSNAHARRYYAAIEVPLPSSGIGDASLHRRACNTQSETARRR